MTREESRNDLMRLVRKVLSDVDTAENPYFTTLVDGRFARADFLETQYQFHSAVAFFSRPMAALAAKIPDAQLRVEIIRNVWEEHGEGDPTRAHGSTFVAFLSRLSGLSPARVRKEIDRRPLWPEVRAFNTLLAGVCVLDDYLVGAATVGIIERMFAEISAWIGRAVVARRMVRSEAMIHYSLHEELDVKHAADFFDVLVDGWGRGPKSREKIEQGLRMGAVVFDQLYARLYRCRKRRWHR